MPILSAQNITKGQVLQYMFMPQILPRLNEFYKTGFSYLAYMIALVYRAVNILPPHHRVFSREFQNRLTIRMVLAAAASELKFSKSHIDQVIIYFAVLIGLVLMIGQFFLMLSYLMMTPAMAQGMPTTYAGFFATPDYANDVAYKLLYTVFGVPELFKATGNTLVLPFHTALHALFQFYSLGLLVVAVFVICYFIFAIVVETAQTGIPFGRRYNHAWVPIRLVMALGLLIPMGYGLNAAQWITLYAAKFGSDFATRGWVLFNTNFTNTYLANPQQRVGTPQLPEFTSVSSFMTLVKGCELGYEALYTPAGAAASANGIVDAYLIKNAAEQTASGGPMLLSNASYQAALDFFNGGDILIRFGVYDTTQHTDWRGSVFPACGDIVIFSGSATEPGAAYIQAMYYYIVRAMFISNAFIGQVGEDFMRRESKNLPISDPNAPLPTPAYKATIATDLETYFVPQITQAVTQQSTSPTWNADSAKLASLGWGGAGVWYNKIAQLNGSLISAVNNVPQPRRMPAVMEYVKQELLQQNTNVPDPGKPVIANKLKLKMESVGMDMEKPLAAIYEYWTKEDTNQGPQASQTKRTSNAFIDAINLVFGTKGLFDMCANADVHPLAQLSALGKGLVESSIRNLGGAALLGGLGMIQAPFVGVALNAASSMLLQVATVTITMGFILFYVLPFMPFLYFFFAVGGWVKGLFEAMIGVPLWALAHIRIDGEGLPGDAAMSGYYLIFEIFLRPILIIFGLLASIVVFSAMVKVLNEIFSLVVTNLAGHDPTTTAVCGQAAAAAPAGPAAPTGTMAYFRGPVDELFYTVLYAIIVYMIGMSCFKLIDLIPNNILRYMNASVNTFNDAANDPAQGLMGKISFAGSQVAPQVIGLGKNAGQAGSGAIQFAADLANPK